MDNKQQMGQNIRAYRQLRGMTQAALAEAIGCAPNTISMYETGKREPDMDAIEAIADIFNVSIRDLVPDKEPKALPAVSSISGLLPEHTYYHEAINGVVTLSDPDGREDPLLAMYVGMSRLSEEDKQKLLDVAKVMFPDAFH